MQSVSVIEFVNHPRFNVFVVRPYVLSGDRYGGFRNPETAIDLAIIAKDYHRASSPSKPEGTRKRAKGIKDGRLSAIIWTNQ